MKAIEWYLYLHVVLFIMSQWMKPGCGTIQMKAIEQYFLVVLFIMLYKVILTFKYVDKIFLHDYLNESYWAVLC